jgi:hypothetical protein
MNIYSVLRGRSATVIAKIITESGRKKEWPGKKVSMAWKSVQRLQENPVPPSERQVRKKAITHSWGFFHFFMDLHDWGPGVQKP